MNESHEKDTRFLASTMHEVRTPIQTILSTTELLSETALNKEQLEYVRQIEFSANALLQLANDVLDYTKIAFSDFHLENIPFDIISLTEKVVDLIAIEGFSKHLEIITNIDYSMPKIVTGDPVRVQQILLNIAKNAVKFTETGYIQISLRMVNGQIYFEVMDSGIGVSKEKRSMIFNSFYQVDSSTTRCYGGIGLGLTICKNLVDIMHGTIGVKDNPSGGSIFYFYLPLELSDFNPEKNFTLDAPTSTKMLIVDDSSLSLLSLEEKMHAMGLKNIVTSASGKDALEKLDQAAKSGSPFTVAFIDMIMPGMDGWRLANEITKNVSLNGLKLYLMVPEGQMGGDAKMKLLNWFNGQIYKPIKRTALLNTLEDAFLTPLDLQPYESDMQPEKKIYSIKDEKPKAVVLKPDEKNVASGLKILIAEDHPVNRKIMETFLSRYGAEVFSAENGEEAVNVVKENPGIDMIFMDILMPVKSGLDATIELRKNNYPGIIIACTANNNDDDFEQYRNQGMNDILIKPFRKEIIKETLEKWRIILDVPEAKQIMLLARLKNETEDTWDVTAFMDGVGNNDKKAKDMLDAFFEESKIVMDKIKQALRNSPVDFKSVENLSERLIEYCDSINAFGLSKLAREINDAAKNNEHIGTEASNLDFSIDFINLKNITENWRTSL